MKELFLSPEALAAYEGRMRLLGSDDPRDWDRIDFPLEVAAELSSACNLRCVMCPVPTTSRPPALMKEEVFEAVASQAGSERGFLFEPQGFGESFLHPRWADFLGRAREKGIGPIVMLTNGMLLDARNTERVLALEVDGLLVSIDGVTQETYGAVRVGGSLEKVEANVLAFLAARGERPRPILALRIIRMRETAAEVEPFLERWRARVRPTDLVLINEYNDWAGKVDDKRVAGKEPGAQESRLPCRMLWRNLSVQADGRVSACCHDSEAELVVGDLRAGETLGDIWRGEKLRRLRTLHREGRVEELPICASCRNWG